MEENEEIFHFSSSTLKRKIYSLRRNNSLSRSRTSPDIRSQSISKAEEPSSTQTFSSKEKNLCKSPQTYDLAFFVALEASSEVRDQWNAVVDTYLDVSSSNEPDESLGQHAQVVYNSTQCHYDRLSKVMDIVKEQHRSKQLDSQSLVPIFNFYRYEKSRFYDILLAESKSRRRSLYDNIASQYNLYETDLFTRYVCTNQLRSLELDGVFNGRNSDLPSCIFKISSLEKLSLCNNNIRSLPADVGRLDRLRCLRLSHNRLKNDSIPNTICFCKELTTLLLDYNSLDAIPGFILKLKNLKTLHRHGNQNYFRTTFMWYGCETRERIRTASFSDVDIAANTLDCATQAQTLQFWASRKIISKKANYFKSDRLSERAKDFISNIYKMFNICAACDTASLLHEQGYFVFTFQNPYLGNTCVPFQHWACSKECALYIEVPARKQQVEMARRQQQSYDRHVRLFISPSSQPIEETTTTNLLCGSSHTEQRRKLFKRRNGRCKFM